MDLNEQMTEKRNHKRFMKSFRVVLGGMEFPGFDVSLTGFSFQANEFDIGFRVGAFFDDVVIFSRVTGYYRTGRVKIIDSRQVKGVSLFGVSLVSPDNCDMEAHHKLLFSGILNL